MLDRASNAQYLLSMCLQSNSKGRHVMILTWAFNAQAEPCPPAAESEGAQVLSSLQALLQRKHGGSACLPCQNSIIVSGNWH